MKLWTIFSLFLLISLIPVSISQDYDDTRLVAPEVWRPETEEVIGKKDDAAEDDDTTKRTRPRNGGKRRRRLRKRPRTTEIPEESKEPLDGAEQAPEEYYDRSRKLPEEEVATPEAEEQPKRRPGKRRRRPHRRYQDNERAQEEVDEAPKPPRRRRKGGRKRVKPVEVIEETLETTTIPETVSETLHEEEEEERYLEIQTTLPTTTTTWESSSTTTTTTTSTTTTESSITQEDVSENAVVKQNLYLEEIDTKVVTEKYSPSPRTRQQVIKDTIKPTVESEQNDEMAFGNKIYDRRTLFSKSRRLPETSAILRRKLTPPKSNSESFNLRIINPLANLESQLDDKEQLSANEVTSKVNVPEGITDLPEIISPKTLIEKIKQLRLTTEEPNYPKFESQKESVRRIVSHRRKTEPTVYKKETTVRQGYQKPETTVGQVHKQETTTQSLKEVTTEEIKQVSTETIIDNTGFGATEIAEQLNVSNSNDGIVDLLKTEGSRISKILELRNMTVNQLLEHRERGSSRFHLSDMFGSKKDEEKEKEKQQTNEKMDENSDQIQFPEEKILGSFPKFLSDQIHKHTQHQVKETTEEIEIKEHRVPRVFESMPEFTTKTQESSPSPTWRIIPNPRLKPVSVQDSLSAETVISHQNTLSPFKRIPVSVKSAIIISGAILALAIFGFLSVLISCRVRQKKAKLRAKQDILCEHLQNEDFMTSQQSLSPVLNKHQRTTPVYTQRMHPNAASNRHYYLWRTLRKTFRYD